MLTLTLLAAAPLVAAPATFAQAESATTQAEVLQVSDSGAVESDSGTIGFLPRGLTSFGAVSEGGWLYVLGGYFGTPHAYSIEGQSGDFLKINLRDPRDARQMEGVVPVQGPELVSWNGKVIRIGGMHARNTAEEPSRLESCTEVRAFDTLAGTWSSLPDLPAPRSSHRCAVIGNTLHVVGGWTLGAEKARPFAESHLTLDLAADELRWEEHEAPFTARALGVAAAAGRLYVIGGITADRSITSNVWIFDTAAKAWTQGPEFPDWGFGVTATDLAGGTQIAASGKSGVVYRLDAGQAGAAWTRCAELAHGRIFHEIVEDHDHNLVALGGIVGMGTRGRVRAIERVELRSAARPELASIERLVVPAPCEARNRFGMFVEGRSVYLFGGNNSLGQHDFEAGNFLDQAWRFDLGNMGWAELESLPAKLQTLKSASGTDGKSGFAVGGFGHNGEDAVTQSASYVYDFEFGDWSEGPALVGSRSQFGLASEAGGLWVFGGLDYDPLREEGHEFEHRLDVLHWDGKADSLVDSGIKIPESRRAFAGANFGGKYYMVGGLSAAFSVLSTVVAFDFGSSEWSTVPSPSRPRVGGDLVPCQGALYLVGGSSPVLAGKGLESNRSIERLDLGTMTWSTVVEDLGMETKHARTIEVDGRLCVLTLHRSGAARIEIAYITLPHDARETGL